MTKISSTRTETGYTCNHLGYFFDMEQINGRWQITKTDSEIDTSETFQKLKDLKGYIGEYDQEEKVEPVMRGKPLWDCPDPEYLLALRLRDQEPTDLEILTLDNLGLIKNDVGEVDFETAERHIENWKKQREDRA